MALRAWVTGLAVSLLVAAPAAGQESFVLELLDDGKPVANVTVRDGTGRTVGSTDAGGTVAFDMSLLDFGKGERVEVWVKECEDGRVEVILVPAGSDDPCVDEDAEAGERCGCRRIGAFPWGNDVTIDIGTGSITSTPPTPPGGATPPVEVDGKDLFAFGATVGFNYWPDFEDIAGDAPGATNVDGTTVSPSFGAFFEGGIPGTGLRVGIAGRYSKLDIESTFGSRTQTGELDYYALGPYLRWEFGDDTSRTAPYLTGGFFHAWNKGDFVGEDEPLHHRVHRNWRANAGGGVVHWATPRFGLWGEALYSPPAGGDDAEHHLGIQVGVSFRPMWNACGGSCVR